MPKQLRSSLRILILLALIALLAACGQPGGGPGGGDPVQPMTIEFDVDAEFVSEGRYRVESGDLVTVKVALSGPGSLLAELTWTASDGEIVHEGHRRVDWQAPLEEGTYSLTLKADPLLHTQRTVETTIVFEVVDICELGEGCIEISDLDDLDDMRNDLSARYILINDINASDSAAMHGGQGFEPIGTQADPFTGSFDGRNHTISGLTAHYPSLDNVGLFGYVNTEGELKNVTLEGLDVEGGEYVGGLAGHLYRGSISNVHVLGDVTGLDSTGGLTGLHYDGPVVDSSADVAVSGADYVGGLIGRVQYGIALERSRTSGSVSGDGHVGGLIGRAGHTLVVESGSDMTVTGSATEVGGLIGVASNAAISGSRFTGAVAGLDMVGGLVGSLTAVHNDRTWAVDRSFVTGSVTGEQQVGGLVGSGNDTSMRDSYSLATVTGDDYVGGLLGRAHNAVAATNVYSAGAVTGAMGSVGGLIGGLGVPPMDADADVASSYWDVQASGQTESAEGEGRTTAQMRTAATYVGWAFDEVWTIDEGADYPDLMANPRD